MKYLILSNGEREIPVIFPNNEIHIFMAAALVSHPAYTDCKVVSAGYIEIGGSVCHGSSESLKMNSREQDSRVIDTVDYLHGFPGAVEELHEAGIDIVELLKKKGEPNEQDE